MPDSTLLCACGCGKPRPEYIHRHRNDRKRRPLAERFWEKVAKGKPDECWEWTASRDKAGYGKISTERDSSPRRANRVAWELHHGPIPDGLWVLHRCDNPPCVNPAHLFLGTPRDNILDMHKKGRARISRLAGADSPRARFTREEVAEIRERYRGNHGEIAELAREFGVAKGTMHRIIRHKAYA